MNTVRNLIWGEDVGAVFGFLAIGFGACLFFVVMAGIARRFVGFMAMESLAEVARSARRGGMPVKAGVERRKRLYMLYALAGDLNDAWERAIETIQASDFGGSMPIDKSETYILSDFIGKEIEAYLLQCNPSRRREIVRELRSMVVRR